MGGMNIDPNNPASAAPAIMGMMQSGMIQGLIKTQDDLVRQIQDLILWKTGVEFNAQKYIDDLAHEQEVNQRLRQPDELKQEKA